MGGGTTVRVPLDDMTGEVLHVTTQRWGLRRKVFTTNGAVFAHLQRLLPHG